MKKYLKYIVPFVLIVIGVIYYNNFAFVGFYNHIKIDAKEIVSDSGHEQTVRLNHQLTRLKQLNSLALNVEYNDDLKDLEKLSKLEKLTLIPIDETARSGFDLKSLPQVSSLKHLILCSFTKEDIDCSSIGNLNNLESITVMDSNIWDWSFVGKLKNLTQVRIVMLHDYNKFKWDGLSLSNSIEVFDATLIYYDKTLLESLKSISSLKRINISFSDYDKLNHEDKIYIEEWISEIKNKNIEVTVE